MWMELGLGFTAAGAVCNVMSIKERKQREEERINKAVDRHFENEKTKNEESK